MGSEVDILLAEQLKKYFGFTTFKGGQDEIIKNVLDGNDTFVLMPTGGGKSLCYQLPAAILHDKTVIVVSPLIALMQDQVAQLTQMGIPSALLNSTLTGDVQSWV